MRFSLPYSRRRILAVRKTPCSRASLPRRTPTTPLESVSGPDGTSANARSAGKSSACRLEPQAAALVVIVGPPAPAGRKTDVTNYGWAASCRLAESSHPFTGREVSCSNVAAAHCRYVQRGCCLRCGRELNVQGSRVLSERPGGARRMMRSSPPTSAVIETDLGALKVASQPARWAAASSLPNRCRTSCSPVLGS